MPEETRNVAQVRVKPMTIRLTEEMWNELHEVAAKDERSVAGAIRFAVKNYIEGRKL